MTPDDRLAQARRARDANDLAGARKMLESTIADGHDRGAVVAAAYLQLGATCKLIGDDAASERAYGCAVALRPDDEDASVAYFHALWSHGRREPALAEALRLVSRTDSDDYQERFRDTLTLEGLTDVEVALVGRIRLRLRAYVDGSDKRPYVSLVIAVRALRQRWAALRIWKQGATAIAAPPALPAKLVELVVSIGEQTARDELGFQLRALAALSAKPVATGYGAGVVFADNDQRGLDYLWLVDGPMRDRVVTRDRGGARSLGRPMLAVELVNELVGR
jgi:hypothetical protein|nr:hypothetical protein [Kofleriaceae bacterium]